MRIAAIDYGKKRIGLAISDPNAKIAFPLTTVPGGAHAISHISQALAPYKNQIRTLLIGLPLLLNGTEGAMAQEVRTFAQQLQTALNLPILFIDERLSSAQADKQLRENSFNRKERSSKIDMAAATLLLQSYLDK